MLQKNRQNLALNIRTIRKRLKLSQQGLAQRCGFKRTYIGAIERREIDMGIDNLDRIAHRLRIPPGYLLLSRKLQARLGVALAKP